MMVCKSEHEYVGTLYCQDLIGCPLLPPMAIMNIILSNSQLILSSMCTYREYLSVSQMCPTNTLTMQKRNSNHESPPVLGFGRSHKQPFLCPLHGRLIYRDASRQASNCLKCTLFPGFLIIPNCRKYD